MGNTEGKQLNDAGLLWEKRPSTHSGNYECQVLGSGPEAEESHHAWGCCSKNPGHASFIPATELCLEHLPLGSRHASVLRLVRNVAARTVRLRVDYTSHHRPDDYAFCHLGGSNILRTGSGWVYDVRDGDGPCQCPDCISSPSPRQKWFKIYVRTAAHVVYDTGEARATRVDLFYDDDKAQEEGRMKTLHGLEVLGKNDGGDSCRMLCATHDENLAIQLEFYTAYQNFAIKSEDASIVVSHPHSQPKKISFGGFMYTWETWRIPNYEEFTYSTATCPGSSGGPVLALSRRWSCWWEAPHSLGGVQGRLNRSGTCGLGLGMYPGGWSKSRGRWGQAYYF